MIKEDILKVVNEFHHNGTLPRGVNATFVSLIPKVNKLVKLCEWKPHWRNQKPKGTEAGQPFGTIPLPYGGRWSRRFDENGYW